MPQAQGPLIGIHAIEAFVYPYTSCAEATPSAGAFSKNVLVTLKLTGQFKGWNNSLSK